jgi:hypothetical protein
MIYCIYCQKETKNLRSKQQHEIRCKENPNAIKVIPSYGMKGKKGANQYTYGATVSDSTREKLSKASKENNNKRWADPASRIKHSIIMKQVALDNPAAYSSSNRGRTRQIEIDGIKLQGQWEVDFYLWAKGEGLKPERPNQGFPYIWNGERTYYPDFYIRSLDTYVEVKGYETERDRAKWLCFPHRLCIIKEQEIKQIRKGCFKGV